MHILIHLSHVRAAASYDFLIYSIAVCI